MQEVTGTVTLGGTPGGQQLAADLRVQQANNRRGSIAGTAIVHTEQRTVDLLDLTIGLGTSPWRLQRTDRPATVRWDESAIAVTPVVFTSGNGNERITVGGDWRSDGNGALRVTASRVSLENLQQAFEQPARYGGMLELDATLRGTRDRPLLTGTLTVNGGRVERVTYQRLSGRVDYAAQLFTIDLRLDQAPGVFLTAKGTLPLAFLDNSMAPQPIDIAIQSSTINLGLIEGITTVVRSVTGEVKLDVHALGMSNDPHVAGTVVVNGASFTVVPTNVAYKKRPNGISVVARPDRRR